MPNSVLFILVYLLLFLTSIKECSRYNCSDSNDCAQTYLICDNNIECIINCGGDGSCFDTTIQCPAASSCVINCVGNPQHVSPKMCRQLIINATSSTTLSVYASDGTHILRNADVYCPSKGKCDLSGSGKFGRSLDIYSIQGFEAVTIYCTKCRFRRLYCTQYFNRSCGIDVSANQCMTSPLSDNDQVCNGNELQNPSQSPSYKPSDSPSLLPSQSPSSNPPSYNPSKSPSYFPSNNPSYFPSNNPSNSPSSNPSKSPSYDPTLSPSYNPSQYPSNNPSQSPTLNPSKSPSNNPSKSPSQSPTYNPTKSPTSQPSSTSPSLHPSQNPTLNPSKSPSIHPTLSPSIYPSTTPTSPPTNNPSPNPTPLPTSSDPLICPDSATGAYNGGILQFKVQTPFSGDLTFDATNSTFDIVQLKAYEHDVNNTGNTANEIATDEDQNNILTLNDTTSNNYIFTIQGQSIGTFNIKITCSSNKPTISPTLNPTISPSATLNICNYTCIDSDAITVDIEFTLKSYILYFDDCLSCFMYHILFHYLSPLDLEFTVCDVDILCIDGVQTPDNSNNGVPFCNGYRPCFVKKRQRRMLMDRTLSDGAITITMSSTDVAILEELQSLPMDELQQQIADTFMDIFSVNLDVNAINTEQVIGGGEKNIFDSDDDDALPPDLRENKSDDTLMGHFSGTTHQWICVGIFFLLLLILFPFEMYYAVKYWRSRFSPYIHSRHPELNTWTNITASLFLVIERPLHAIHRLSVYNVLWFQWLRLLFYYVGTQLLFAFVILRFWLLLFDIKWTKSMTNKEWKKHIDDRYKVTEKQSFWQRSHKTWGNYTFVRKYVVTFSLALSAIPALVVFQTNKYFLGSITHGLLLGVGTLLLLMLWKTTPIYDDKFKIMDECGFVLTWIGVAILFDLLLTSLKIIFGETFWIWFLSFSVPFLLLTGVIFIQSHWVLSEMNKSKTLNSVAAYRSKVQLTHLNLLLDEDDDDLSQNDSGLRERVHVSMTLHEVLANKLGCHQFISHLLKEFSCENILSVIEMTQYKQFYIEWNSAIKQNEHITDCSEDDDDDEKKELNGDGGGDDLSLHGSDIVQLPKNLPQSTIVWNVPIEMVTQQDIIKKIRLLYEKYIKVGCELELNISFKLRRELTKKYSKLDKMDDIQLYIFFDRAIESMVTLMQDSYTRFRMTKGFIEYEGRFMRRRLKMSNVESIYSIKEKIMQKMTPHHSI